MLSFLIAIAAITHAYPTVKFQVGNEFNYDFSMPLYMRGRPVAGRVPMRQGTYGLQWNGGTLAVEAWAQSSGCCTVMKGSGTATVDGEHLRLGYSFCKAVSPGAPIALRVGWLPVRWLIQNVPHRNYIVSIEPHFAGLCPGVDPNPVRIQPPIRPKGNH